MIILAAKRRTNKQRASTKINGSSSHAKYKSANIYEFLRMQLRMHHTMTSFVPVMLSKQKCYSPFCSVFTEKGELNISEMIHHKFYIESYLSQQAHRQTFLLCLKLQLSLAKIFSGFH